MKAKRRHELQTNQLADWLGKEIEKVKPYVGWMIGGVIVLAILLVFWSIRSSRFTGSLAEGWEKYEDAQADGFEAVRQRNAFRTEDAVKRLLRVAGDFSGQPLGYYARLAIGDIHLENGTQQIETNKTLANDEFKKASEHFAAVAEGTPQAELRNRAYFSLAKSYEWQMQLSKARESYAKVEGPFQAAANARVQDLERKSTVDFYTKFAKWKPKPPPPEDADDDQTASRYPEFELDDDQPGEIDYQRYLDSTAAGTDMALPDAEPSAAEAEPPAADADTDGVETPLPEKSKAADTGGDTETDSGPALE